MKASSIEIGSTCGVNSSIRARTCRLTVAYLSMFGRITVACGQSLFASNIGIAEPHHSMSHHGNNPEKLANLVKLNTYHMSLFAKFVEKLKSTPDGDGSLLDHSLILYGSGMSESDIHSRLNIPTAIIGHGAGLVAGNRHIEGVMVIGLLLGVLEALVSGYLTSTLRDAVAFGVLVVVLVFKPKGLFGSYDV